MRQIRRYDPSRRLLPFIGDVDDCPRMHVNLAPGSYRYGQALGQVATTSANEVHTLTVTGTPTGGTFTLSGIDPFSGQGFTTAAIAYNAAAAAVASAVQAAIGVAGGVVTGGGGALPGAAVTLTYSGALAGIPIGALTVDVTGLTGGTPAATVAETTQGRTAGTYGKYADGAGTDPCKVLLEYDVYVDGSGRHYVGSLSGPYSEWGQSDGSAPAYLHGTFAAKDVTGLDANGLADLQGRLISGTLTDGVLSF